MFNEEGEEYRKYGKSNYIKVVRKQDVLKCIDDNIIDKDVALAVITQCEMDAANYLINGKWTGIPYIGNISIKVGNIALRENRDILEAARQDMTKHEFILFKKEIVADANNRYKYHKYISYVASKMANANKPLYERLVKKYGFNYAKLCMYFYANLKVVGDINNTGDNDEQQFNNR